MTKGSVIAHINLARGYRGGERQTELLIAALAQQGVRQRLIARRGEPLADAVRQIAGVEVVEVSQPFSTGLKYCRDMAVLQVHEAKAGHLACLANRLYGVPYVVTRRVDKPPRASWLNRQLYGRAARVVTVSSVIAEVLKRQFPGVGVETIHDAHSGLPQDSRHIDEIRERFAGKFLLGHAGALVNRHKGQLYLIRAMQKLAADYPKLHLLLLGEGEDEAMLKAAAAELDNISFMGFSQRLGDYMQALDIFVFPSLYEGLGSVLLDAMHAGLPVIASDVGGIPDIVKQGENGLLVPPGNEAALAQAIIELYEHEGLRTAMAAAGKRVAAMYSPGQMAEKYHAIYESLLESK